MCRASTAREPHPGLERVTVYVEARASLVRFEDLRLISATASTAARADRIRAASPRPSRTRPHTGAHVLNVCYYRSYVDANLMRDLPWFARALVCHAASLQASRAHTCRR